MKSISFLKKKIWLLIGGFLLFFISVRKSEEQFSIYEGLNATPSFVLDLSSYAVYFGLVLIVIYALYRNHS